MPKRMEIHFKEKGATATARSVRRVDEATERVARSTHKAAAGMDRMRLSTSGLRRTLGVLRNNLLLVTFAFGGAMMVVKKSISMAGDAIEIYSKFNAVFKEHTVVTEAWAIKFGEAVGRARTDVLEWLSILQDTFVPLGFARDKAAELSRELVKLAVDVASFNNQADATVIRDFQSALVGNHETVRKYGIVITETTLKQQSMKKTMTDQEKVQARLGLLISGTADAQGDAIRTADSYNNRVKAMNAEVKSLSETIGRMFIPAATGFVNAVGEMADAANKFLTDKELRASIESQITANLKLLDTYQANLEFWKGARQTVYAQKQVKQWQELEDRTVSLLDVLIQMNNIQDKQVPTIRELAQAHVEWLVQLINIKGTLPDISEAMEKTEKKMRTLLDPSKGMVGGLRMAGQLAGNLSSALLNAGDTGVSAAAAFHDAWHRALRSIIAQIAANAAIFALANFLVPGAGVAAKSGGFWGALLGGVKFAQRGMDEIVYKPTVIVAGERQPERVRISSQAGPAPSGNVYHIHLHAPILEDYVRNDLLPVLTRVQAMG